MLIHWAVESQLCYILKFTFFCLSKQTNFLPGKNFISAQNIYSNLKYSILSSFNLSSIKNTKSSSSAFGLTDKYVHCIAFIMKGALPYHCFFLNGYSLSAQKKKKKLCNNNCCQLEVSFWLFQSSIRNCLNCVHNCDDHSWLDFKSAVQYMKHFIYHFTIIVV